MELITYARRKDVINHEARGHSDVSPSQLRRLYNQGGEATQHHRALARVMGWGILTGLDILTPRDDSLSEL